MTPAGLVLVPAMFAFLPHAVRLAGTVRPPSLSLPSPPAPMVPAHAMSPAPMLPMSPAPMLPPPAVKMSAAVVGASFWSLLGAFVSGGLFFSTVVTTVAAAYAFGVDNIKRLALVLQVVAKRVLKIAIAMLRAAWLALFDDQSTTRWADAGAALRQGFEQTRQAAAEGVDAIKLEASLYAAAVGAPGLLPLQYVLDRLTPSTLVPALEGAISDSLGGVNNPNIRRMRLKRFDIGSTPPRLMAARLYDLGNETIALDVDVSWPSAITAEVEVTTAGVGARVPVTVRNLRFDGAVRVMILELQPAGPGYGAVLVSFPSAPKVVATERL